MMTPKKHVVVFGENMFFLLSQHLGFCSCVKVSRNPITWLQDAQLMTECTALAPALPTVLTASPCTECAQMGAFRFQFNHFDFQEHFSGFYEDRNDSIKNKMY